MLVKGLLYLHITFFKVIIYILVVKSLKNTFEKGLKH